MEHCTGVATAPGLDVPAFQGTPVPVLNSVLRLPIGKAYAREDFAALLPFKFLTLFERSMS